MAYCNSSLRYILILLSITVVLLILALVTNRVVDPYSLFESDSKSSWNFTKPQFHAQDRLGKAFAIRNIKPNAIILGTSRCGFSMDPKHPGWKDLRVYNLCVGGASMYEAFRFLQHAHSFQPKLKVLLSLDFLMFNNNVNPKGAGFREDYMSVDYQGVKQDMVNPYLLIASFDMLKASIKTVFSQSVEDSHLANGMKNQDFINNQIYKNTNVKFYFSRVEKNYLSKYYHNFSYKSKEGDALDYFEKIIDLSYKNNIDLKIMISPIHARLMEVLFIKGLWDKYENWKRKIVNINKRAANWSNLNSFPVWDFSGYSNYTTEDLQSVANNKKTLKWFWESSHFKKEVGDIMLDQVLGCKKNNSSVYNNFGIKITIENIENHLKNIRRGRLQWRENSFIDYSEIHEMLL
jgi:hypothetical protein